LFSSRCRFSEVRKQAGNGRKGQKQWRLEEIKNKTNETVSYLVAALESGQSDVLTQYLNAMARFHNYSFGNIMLIAKQKPQAANVAGIRTWNSLGRFVKRGEKGIMLLAPMIGRKKTDGVAESTADAKETLARSDGANPHRHGLVQMRARIMSQLLRRWRVRR
jgi:hypothetical protein